MTEDEEKLVGGTSVVAAALDRAADSMTRVAAEFTDLRHELRVENEDRRQAAQRFRFTVGVIVILLVAVLAVGLGNRGVATLIRDCLEPGHACSTRLAAQQAHHDRVLLDTDSNGVADIEEVRAKLENRPPVTLPPVPAIPPVHHGTDYSLILIGIVALVAIGAGGQWVYIHWRLRLWDAAARRIGGSPDDRNDPA
jgi:hypothetical protein